MYPRVNYEMTEEDLKEILAACKPVPMIMLQCGTPPSPQENANRAWGKLGEKMGFDSDTVQPIEGKGNRFFTAIPSETETQKEERLKKECEVKKANEVKKIKSEIDVLTEALNKIEGKSSF